MVTLENKLEAFLFFRGEAEKKQKIAELLEVTLDEVEGAVNTLATSLAERGLRVLSVGDEVELVTAPETSDVVARVRKDEMARDLGKAGAETLAIVLYRGPVSKADIEYIRGVQCSFVLRGLLIRGLVERVQNPKNTRSVLYAPTAGLLKHLGVTTVSELPEYGRIQAEVAVFEKRKEGEDVTSEDEVVVSEKEDAGLEKKVSSEN
jgi:segregation and condensation protein B